MSFITATDAIDNFDDILDSMVIVERIDELEDILTEYEELPDELMDELIALRDLAADGEDYSEDWAYGVPLIRESHFTEYAQELCEELYGWGDPTGWSPANYIDWERVANDMAMDYSIVTFKLNGESVDYYVR